MATNRMWRVLAGNDDSALEMCRTESQDVAYDTMRGAVRHAVQMGDDDAWVEVHVDERDGRGWQLYERLDPNR